MKSTQHESLTGTPSDDLCPLKSILCTEELQRRPSRPPDYQTENRALVKLAQGLADSPQTILQTLADTVFEVFQAGSAGLSLLDKEGKKFYWPAIAGGWKPHIGGGTPREFGPCGDVLEHNAPLLFKRWEKRYSYLETATPLAEEGLLVPFYVHGKAVGTLWAISHDDRRRFDAEDLRQLESLGRFASAAYQAVELQDAQNARQVALNLMEAAVQARRAMESLNVELRESEERFHAIADNIPQLAWLVEPGTEGKAAWFNKAWLDYTGTTMEQNQGTGWHAVLHPDYAEAVLRKFEHHVHECLDWEDTFPLRGQDGQYRWFLSRMNVIRDVSGKAVRIFGTNTDVTDQRETQNRLAEANEVISSRAEHLEKLVAERTARLQETVGELEGFSYSITPDLRAPLRAMQSFSNLLLESNGARLDVAGKDFLRRIGEAAQRMDRLIQDVLVYSRALRGDLRLERVDAGKLLRGMFETYLDFQKPKAEVTVEGELPAVLGKEAALTQCFSNLLTNAIRFVAPGTQPRVRISAERRGPMVRLWFADNGIGIAGPYQDKIFELFHRLETSFEGTGLGLAIVRKAVERMGGRVGVESEPGQGSRFWLELQPADGAAENL